MIANLISPSAAALKRNKRYVVWFYLMNLVLAFAGTEAFSTHAHGVLDHSLHADTLLHGFDLGTLTELLSRPEFGPMQSSTMPSLMLAVLFLLASVIFMPGVLLGFSSDHRISRQEFYRSCGQNVWRFVRLFVLFAIVAGIIGGILFGLQGALVKAVDQAANDDRLPSLVHFLSLCVIFLVMTVIRIWFDLAQADVVLRDEHAVRRSLSWGLRATFRNLGRLLGSYVLISIVAAVILVVGIVVWHLIVPPSSVVGAFLVSQAILILLLAMRFWQRAAAVSFQVRSSAEASVEADSRLAAIPA